MSGGMEYKGPMWPMAAIIFAVMAGLTAMCTGSRCDMHINIGTQAAVQAGLQTLQTDAGTRE